MTELLIYANITDVYLPWRWIACEEGDSGAYEEN